MLSTEKYYKPTGILNILRLPLVILLIIPIWLVSFLYAGLLHWSPITFLSPLIFGVFALVVGQIIVLGINLAEVQNRGAAKVIGLLFFLASFYFSWANFLTIWLDSYPIRMLQPNFLWESFQKLITEGAYSTFSFQLNGYFGVIIWILEAILLGFYCVYIASSTVEHDVYCTNCTKWINPIEKFFTFQYSDEKELIKNFKDGAFTFLDESQEIQNDLSSYYQIDASCCNTCANSYYLSLLKVTREKDESEPETTIESTELMVEHLHASRENFKTLYAKSLHWMHYTESGKFKHSLWLGIPFLGAIIYFFGMLYQSITTYMENYFVTGLALFFFIIGLSYLTKQTLEHFDSRNSVVSNYFGLIIGSIAVYLTNMAMFAENGAYLWDPDLLWLGISKLTQRHEWESLAWTGLIVESSFLLLGPTLGASMVATSRVYCEKCKEWANEEDDIMDFSYENEEELKEKFRTQSLGFLENMKAIPSSDQKTKFFRINAEWCKKCETIHTLSLETVTRTYDFRDRTYDYSSSIIYEDLIYTHEGFDKVMAFAKNWKKLNPLEEEDD